MAAGTAVKRYEGLGLSQALSRAYDYAAACSELSRILRNAYSKLPKNLQSLVFRDTISAFRLLPTVQTSCGIASANFLLQAAEVVLPKQKKTLAVSEFKHAVVARKRRCKTQQYGGGSMQLPEDVLVHIFSFLDMSSLVTVSLVCRAWNSSASDNTLWQLQYSLLFGKYGIHCKTKEKTGKLVGEKGNVVLQRSIGLDPITNLDWREAFKEKYMGNSSWRNTSNWAFCGHCKLIIWRRNSTCARSHPCSKLENQQLNIRPVSLHKVVEYLLGEDMLTISSSDSDSDSEESSVYTRQLPKLWAYPRLTSSS